MHITHDKNDLFCFRCNWRSRLPGFPGSTGPTRLPRPSGSAGSTRGERYPRRHRGSRAYRGHRAERRPGPDWVHRVPRAYRAHRVHRGPRVQGPLGRHRPSGYPGTSRSAGPTGTLRALRSQWSTGYPRLAGSTRHPWSSRRWRSW